jgi:methyltransferase (TIGR00027 family)
VTDHHPSVTALIAAFGRAHHARTSAAPIFHDALAHAWFTDEETADLTAKLSASLAFFDPETAARLTADDARVAEMLRQQTLPISLPRARFTEDLLRAHDLRQYVIIGAGLDTAAFRFPHVRVIELDHPRTQRWKRERLPRLAPAPPANLHLVEIDLATPPTAIHVRNALATAPLDPRAPTLFAILGVTYYLPLASLRALLAALDAPPGSQLVFDFQDPDAFDPARAAPRTTRMHEATRRAGEPMQTPLAPAHLADELGRAAWHLAEQLGPPQIAARFLGDRADAMPPIAHFHLARAMR